MSSKLRTEAKVLGALMLLSFGVSVTQMADATDAKNQSDVDAVKLSKDDNQTQVKPAKNNHKQGAPLPFEGPPAKSGAAASNASTTSTNKKP